MTIGQNMQLNIDRLIAYFGGVNALAEALKQQDPQNAASTAMTTSQNNRVIIFDTTMRDGEQSPGASMTKEEKIRIARQLEKMGVDVIEAGFAAASPGDFESVNAIAKIITNATVCSLARAVENDVRKAGESGENRQRIYG